MAAGCDKVAIMAGLTLAMMVPLITPPAAGVHRPDRRQKKAGAVSVSQETETALRQRYGAPPGASGPV